MSRRAARRLFVAMISVLATARHADGVGVASFAELNLAINSCTSAVIDITTPGVRLRRKRAAAEHQTADDGRRGEAEAAKARKRAPSRVRHLSAVGWGAVRRQISRLLL